MSARPTRSPPQRETFYYFATREQKLAVRDQEYNQRVNRGLFCKGRGQGLQLRPQDGKLFELSAAHATRREPKIK